jgi:membrane protein implicated in regulation of membrane protease activity
MTVADIYLICFIVGFATTVVAALSGTHHFHLPGFDHFHLPGFDHGHAWHGHHTGGHASVLSFGNLAAFLTWFGGVGYLLTQFSGMWLWLAFMLAIVGGLLGGAVIFWVSIKLLADDKHLDSADYEMVGVLGQLTSGIREGGGIGEMSFSQDGARRSAPARSDNEKAIAKGTEVLVTRYERGVAYVHRWEDLSEGTGQAGVPAPNEKENE